MRHFAFRVFVMLAVTLLANNWGARAQGPAAESSARPAVKKVAAETPVKRAVTAKAPTGPQEGIKVHGDWAIVIRNQDGSVASRHEFKNGLVNLGVLPQILAHKGSVGRWQVYVEGISSQHPCVGQSGSSLPCYLLETTGTPTFGTLQVTDSPTNLTIRGSIQAANTTQLALVGTMFDVCPASFTPSPTCIGFTGAVAFTTKDISPFNIRVQAGQTIDVTVAISFS